MSEVDTEQVLAPDPVEAPEERADPERELRDRISQRLKGTTERRQFSATMECRTLDDGTIRMGGYASVTETPYQVGPFTETIKRGAFKRTLSEGPSVVLLVNHEGLPLASTKTNTLVLQEDARGLRWDADLDSDDPDSLTLARKVERGLIDECSFAFMCTDDGWSEDRSHRDVRSLSIHKGDVSCVTFGASDATSVGLRALTEELEQRAGKKLSAKTRGELETMQEALAALLAEPASEGDTEPNSPVSAGREALQAEQAPAPEPALARSAPPLVDRRAQQRLDLLRMEGRR